MDDHAQLALVPPELGAVPILAELVDPLVGRDGARFIVVATTGAVTMAAATMPAAIFVPRFQVCGCESTTGACPCQLIIWVQKRPGTVFGSRSQLMR